MNSDKRSAVRQGDVLVVPVSAVERLAPSGKLTMVETDGPVILAHGEVTGHCHIISRGAAMFRDDGSGGGVYIDVSSAADSLTHQEHKALPVASGLNRVLRQRVCVSGLVRRVED